MNARESQILKILEDHFSDTQWYKDAVAERDHARDIRNKRAQAMTLREEEWSGKSPKDANDIKAKIRKEIEEAIQ